MTGAHMTAHVQALGCRIMKYNLWSYIVEHSTCSSVHAMVTLEQATSYTQCMQDMCSS